jgi:hypothetical protein
MTRDVPRGKAVGMADAVDHASDRTRVHLVSPFTVWGRSRVVTSLKARVAFVLVSRLNRQMYANTGITTDSARVARSTRWARWLGLATRRLFLTRPMPHLQVPEPGPATPTTLLAIGRR